MDLVLVRHGTRETGGAPDKLLPLTAQGRSESIALGQTLCRRDLRPDVVFCSWYAHARETAQLIAETCAAAPSVAAPARTAEVVEMCALTPQFPGSTAWALERTWAGIPILQWIAGEATKTGNDLERLRVAVFVMHQPRLTQLLSGITGGTVTRSSFGFGDGICVRAASLDRLLAGQGEAHGALLEPGAAGEAPATG